MKQLKTQKKIWGLNGIGTHDLHYTGAMLYHLSSISYPEPSNFLQHMLDKNEGLWKGLVLKVCK